MAMTYFDEAEVRKTIMLMKPNGQLFEVRAIYGTKQVMSGYFRDADTLIKALHRINLSGCNVYITLNSLKAACYSRTQKDHFEKNSKATTSDTDIDGYDWLMIDLDPERPTDTSSSEEEIQAAKNLGNRIFVSLRNMGFETPLTAYSGNGVHLLYKIQLANSEERRGLLKRCLEVLDILFSNDLVKVDTKVSNPARVCKLYGCLSQKGSDTPDRPHRMSHVIGNPTEIKVTDVAYLEKLANVLPQETEKPQQYNNYSPTSFNLEEWLNKYRIDYKPVSYSGGTKYILDHCPFDENHKGKDAVLFRSASGAIGFHCFHMSCADKHWSDFRKLYEPTAYEYRERQREQKMYYSFNRNRKPPEPKPIEQKDEKTPIFLTAMDILNLDEPEKTFIKTGIDIIDRKMRGLQKGYVSVWSGLRGSAKSTVLSQIAINARDMGNNVAMYSGELRPKNFMEWMMLQAAGKGYNKPSQYEGFYYTPKETQKKIAQWLGQHFWLYNNEYGNNFTSIIAEIEKNIVEKKLDLLILDNLMAFDISDLGQSKWDAQSQFVFTLTRLAKTYNIHVAFVAHPRKSQGFLRFDDISGTADLGNAVDNAFIVHRNNNDFKRFSKDMFHWSDDDEVYQGTNVVEIVKDRDGGTQDVFIPLYYEVESKRLKNYVAENVIYGWNEAKKEIEVDLDGFEEMSDGKSDPFG